MERWWGGAPPGRGARGERASHREQHERGGAPLGEEAPRKEDMPLSDEAPPRGAPVDRRRPRSDGEASTICLMGSRGGVGR
jgi:hypothetical protein